MPERGEVSMHKAIGLALLLIGVTDGVFGVLSCALSQEMTPLVAKLLTCLLIALICESPHQ